LSLARTTNPPQLTFDSPNVPHRETFRVSEIACDETKPKPKRREFSTSQPLDGRSFCDGTRNALSEASCKTRGEHRHRGGIQQEGRAAMKTMRGDLLAMAAVMFVIGILLLFMP
jgi:hypothetical protein